MSLLGNILGVRMQLMLGASPVALPAPSDALLAIEEIEVKLSDTKESGFKMVLKTGRSGPLNFLEAPFVADERFDVGARVIVTMIFDITPQVIFDGVVTKRNYSPTSGRLTLLGRDLSHELDKEVKVTQHPAMDETMIATLIAVSYPQFGMIPMVLPPKVIDPPLPIDRVPQQLRLGVSEGDGTAPRLRHVYRSGAGSWRQHALLGTARAPGIAAAHDHGRQRTAVRRLQRHDLSRW